MPPDANARPPRTLRTLLTELIDYAGLFPPAKLSMHAAVEAYNRHRMGEEAWALGRFVCPVSRLAEFEAAASVLMPGTAGTSGYREQADAGEPWRLSAIIDGPLPPALDAIDRFNQIHSQEAQGLARIDMLEVKVAAASEIDAILDEMPEDVFPFIEFPVSLTEGPGDCRGFVAALSGERAGAKIRTGGVVGNAFPTVDEIAEFLHACAAASVPFKATAGLHHPVRGSFRLTYEKDAASCIMHGFLNLFVAACHVVRKGSKPDLAVTRAILAAEDPSDFRFADEVLGWRTELLEHTDLARARETFALSFGSCSFDEPFEDLTRLALGS